MTITDWIQAISTLILVGVTAFYAWKTYDLSKDTKRQANASVQMAEEMRNAISPSITMQWIGTNPNTKEISASLQNTGFGPALNLKCYLTHKTHKEFDFQRKFDGYTTFDVGQKYTLTLSTESFDFKMWKGLNINCDYESILGDKFSSVLECESENKRSLKRIKLNERSLLI